MDKKSIDYTRWKDQYQERAAFLEYEASDKYLTRELAENKAIAELKEDFVKYYNLPYYGGKNVSQYDIIKTANKLEGFEREVRKDD